MDTSLLLRLFILQLVDRHKMLDNQYGLTRFFAKSSVLPDKLYKELNNLQEQGLIKVKEIKNTVKYYDVTDLGKQFLNANYSINNLKPYLHDIEGTGLFINILQKI